MSVGEVSRTLTPELQVKISIFWQYPSADRLLVAAQSKAKPEPPAQDLPAPLPTAQFSLPSELCLGVPLLSPTVSNCLLQ